MAAVDTAAHVAYARRVLVLHRATPRQPESPAEYRDRLIRDAREGLDFDPVGPRTEYGSDGEYADAQAYAVRRAQSSLGPDESLADRAASRLAAALAHAQREADHYDGIFPPLLEAYRRDRAVWTANRDAILAGIPADFPRKPGDSWANIVAVALGMERRLKSRRRQARERAAARHAR